MKLTPDIKLLYGLDSRVNAVEGDIKEIVKDVKGIKENHLAHIQASMAVFENNFVAIDKFNNEMREFMNALRSGQVKGIVDDTKTKMRVGFIEKILYGLAGVAGGVITTFFLNKLLGSAKL